MSSATASRRPFPLASSGGVHVTLGGARRPALELDADIAPGDSGAPLTRDGKIIGVVFARGQKSAWAVAL